MNRNNPAARLYGLLFDARRKPQEPKVREIWSDLFGIEADNTTEVLRAHADLLSLVADARAAVSALDAVDRQLYLRPFDQIEKAFAAANLEVQWKQIRNQLDDATMARLELVSETLGRMAPEPMADEDELALLEEEVDALFDSVVEGELEQQLKSVILESLATIRRAVRTYQVFGINGLVDALTRSAGGVMVKQAELRKRGDTGDVKGFLRILGHLNQIVALATNSQRLFGQIIDQLSLPPGS